MDNEVVQSFDTPDSTATAKRRLPAWVIVVAFALLIGFLALIGVGLGRSMEGGLSAGAAAPAFSVTTFDGQPLKSSDYAGKVMVINFWASWCKPCEQEAAELEQAHQFYKDRDEVVFIGLAYLDTETNSKAYLDRFGITYPNAPDLATKVSQAYGVGGVPETFIIDRNGKLAYFKAGPFLSVEEITSIVDGILAK